LGGHGCSLFLVAFGFGVAVVAVGAFGAVGDFLAITVVAPEVALFGGAFFFSVGVPGFVFVDFGFLILSCLGWCEYCWLGEGEDFLDEGGEREWGFFLVGGVVVAGAALDGLVVGFVAGDDFVFDGAGGFFDEDGVHYYFFPLMCWD
jgi:hypothetical protein